MGGEYIGGVGGGESIGTIYCEKSFFNRKLIKQIIKIIFMN